MICPWEEMLTRPIDWFKHSNMPTKMVRSVQLHGDQVSQPWFQIMKTIKLKLIGEMFIKINDINKNLRIRF